MVLYVPWHSMSDNMERDFTSPYAMKEDWQQEMEALFLSKLLPEGTVRCAI